MDAAGPKPHSALLEDDQRLLVLLRTGDEAVFVALVKRYHRAMVRLAASFVKQNDIAEEVTQEAWRASWEPPPLHATRHTQDLARVATRG